LFSRRVAQLHGLAERLNNELRVRVWVAEDPMTCVARGAGIVLDDLEEYENFFVDIEREHTQTWSVKLLITSSSGFLRNLYMRNLLSSKTLRNLIIVLVVVGILFLAISGYLTPVFSLSISPLISAQSWLSQRYLAVKDFFTSPRDMASLRAQNAQLEMRLRVCKVELSS